MNKTIATSIIILSLTACGSDPVNYNGECAGPIQDNKDRYGDIQDGEGPATSLGGGNSYTAYYQPEPNSIFEFYWGPDYDGCEIIVTNLGFR